MMKEKEEELNCFEVSHFANAYLKFSYGGKNLIAYEIEYENFSNAKKQLSLENIGNGIYFILSKNNEDLSKNNMMYVGQTTQGLKRFESKKHKFINKMKEDSNSEIKIIFFDFSHLIKQPSKNILDYIENYFIKKVDESSLYEKSNDNNGNTSGNKNILDNPLEIQFLGEILCNINKLLSILKLNFSKENEEINDKNIFFLKNEKGKKYDATIVKSGNLWTLKKGSLVNVVNFFKDFGIVNLDSNDKLSIEKIKDKFKWNHSVIAWMYKNLKKVNKENILNEDISWESPSNLVSFTKGQYSSNGWKDIKNKDGQTPDEIYRS
ncbi:MAG: hypothetical protein TYPL_1710 [Candidatus Tyloplasma litorale]|nr:MAG: hypothetical protein TYPL_1710 [Mycoplasmatales bacterium]